MPSVFTGPSPGATTDPPWQPTLVYPARGVAAVWEAKPAPVPDALERLLGRTRARLLATLDHPHTASALVRALGVSAGAVSLHTATLRDAGLISGRRDGRHVIWCRTALGDRLLDPAGGQGDP